MAAVTGSRQQVVTALRRLDLHLRILVWRLRTVHSEEAADALSEAAQIDALLEQPLGAPAWAAADLDAQAGEVVAAALERLDAQMAAELEAFRAAGLRQRLPRLGTLFDLTPVDLDLALVALAPELDLRYGRLYAYLQQQPGGFAPTVELALNILGFDFDTRLALQTRLSAAAPLRSQRLLHLLPNPPGGLPFLAQTLKLDDRIRRYLLDDDSPEADLLGWARRVEPGERAQAAPRLPSEWLARLPSLARAPEGLRMYLTASEGDQDWLGGALAEALDLPLMAVAGNIALAQAGDFPGRMVDLGRALLREARLQEVGVFWSHFDPLFAENRRADLARLWAELADFPGPLILSGAAPWETGLVSEKPAVLRLALPLPDTAARQVLWKTHLNNHLKPPDLASLAGRFRLNAGQIDAAAETAHMLARWRDPQDGRPGKNDLFRAAQKHSTPRLASFAERIPPFYTWDDIVLPPEALAQLSALRDQVRFRAQVLETWGFERKLALGKGVNALFAGPPGTGKTMAADILAGELGLELFRIDLAGVVSKYIGETEKNLSQVFAEAAAGQAILFFDEADALFGKRTEVKDAHDRYANLEVSYLLQRMDAYEGVVILASNLRQNMDRAFLRRLHFMIDFPFPGAAERLCIWERIWPEETPLDAGLDLQALAETLEVPGGNIRNIALAAAYLAATAGLPIGAAHLLRAAESEYRKIGKRLAGADLERLQALAGQADQTHRPAATQRES